MTNSEVRAASDYQVFRFEQDGMISGIGDRLGKKLKALDGVLPDVKGKSVLDIGTDFGFWAFRATERGASRVVGLDRGREVRNLGYVDTVALNNETAATYPLHSGAEFHQYEAGRQWGDIGKFDVVLCMSLYHHIYNNCGDHEPIWYWLWRQTEGELIWENPVDARDQVVQMNVHHLLHDAYNETEIRAAAERYFDIEFEGPALHEPYRVVWKCVPKEIEHRSYTGSLRSGAGGATHAWLYADGRRTMELAAITGMSAYPGSLNVDLETDFNWDERYFRVAMLDLKDRRTGLEGEWAPKVARLYPVKIRDVNAYIFRFETDGYPSNFVELIAEERLRDKFSDTIIVEN